MEIRKIRGWKINRIILVVACSLNVAHAMNNGFYSLEPINKPLTLSPIPAQQAQANASFKFNLKSAINSLKPELNYRISFIWSGAENSSYAPPFELRTLPSGIIQTNDGDNTCSAPFKLKYQQSCILRFYVNKNNYVYVNNKNGPVVYCLGYAVHPTLAHSFHAAIPHIGEPTQLFVTPSAQDGLKYDSSTLSITGIPTRTGNYHFTIRASNGISTTEPQDLKIKVDTNPHDTSVFKHHYSFASAMPEHEYRLNLMDLIESSPGFAVSNQINFRMHIDSKHPSWLSLDKEKPFILQGQPPPSDAGQIKEVTLIATSNTGGDSLPMTIQIPVAFEPEKKPVIKNGIELIGEAGTQFNTDFREKISDPTADGSLKLILDKIEPSAPWLAFSQKNHTELGGIVPENAWGQLYQLTLHANTAIGGNSDSVTIPLQIEIDSLQTPKFYSDKPLLPLLYAGQPFFYDFVEYNEISPVYSDIPYTVELAKNHNNPPWLRIENNKLIADRVPDNLKKIRIFITVQNIPGGKSGVWPVDLFIMR